MTTVVRSKRILRGGYLPGEEALIAGPVYLEANQEKKVEGPSAAEIERNVTARIDAAKKQAFEDGFRKGVLEGQRQVEPEIELLRGMMRDLEAGVSSVWKEIEAGAAKLGVEIGRKIVGEAALDHEALALNLAQRGVIQAREQTKVTLMVHPDDAPVIRAAQAEILRASEGVREIEILERSGMNPGGLIVECEVGQFDLRPEIQMEAIEEALMVTERE